MGAPFKLPDLVMLDANPLDDIRHPRGIHAVVVDGCPYKKTELETMLTEVEALRVKAETKSVQEESTDPM